MGNGISNLYFPCGFNAGNNIAYIAGGDAFSRRNLEFKHAHLIGVVFFLGGQKLNTVAFMECAVHHSEIGNNASKRVKHRVKNQGLKGSVRISFGMRNAVNNGFQYFIHTLSGFSGSRQNVFQIAANKVYNLVRNLFGHGGGQVHFIEYRNNFQVMLNGQVEVRNGLRLNALGGIYNKQCSFASCNRS